MPLVRRENYKGLPVLRNTDLSGDPEWLPVVLIDSVTGDPQMLLGATSVGTWTLDTGTGGDPAAGEWQRDTWPVALASVAEVYFNVLDESGADRTTALMSLLEQDVIILTSATGSEPYLITVGGSPDISGGVATIPVASVHAFGDAIGDGESTSLVLRHDSLYQVHTAAIPALNNLVSATETLALSRRMKANIISGVDGVAAGDGVVGTNTQRVCMASDSDPLLVNSDNPLEVTNAAADSDGLLVDTEMASSTPPADGATNSSMGRLSNYSMVFNGTTWDRERGWSVDSGNSRTANIASGATWEGTGADLTGYAVVCVTIFSSHDSATDGMTFQFSTDNSNWDDVYVFTMDVSSADTRRFQFPVCAQYFRIRYTNGGTTTTSFRAQTILHRSNQLTSIHRLVDDMSQDRSAQVVKSVLFGKGQGGSPNFKPIDVTNGGNLKVSIEERTEANWSPLAADKTDASTLTASYASLKDWATDVKLLDINYNGDQPILLSFDAGTTDHLYVTPGFQRVYDFASNGIVADSLEVHAKHDGTAPAKGYLYLGAVG